MDFICPFCDQRKLVPRTFIGKMIRCHKCRARSEVSDKHYTADDAEPLRRRRPAKHRHRYKLSPKEADYLSVAFAAVLVIVGVGCFIGACGTFTGDDVGIAFVLSFIGFGTFIGAWQLGMGSQGNLLQRSVAELGDVRGLSKEDVISTLGEPSAVSYLARDRELLQWMANGYHVALLFRNDICLGVRHEFSA